MNLQGIGRRMLLGYRYFWYFPVGALALYGLVLLLAEILQVKMKSDIIFLVGLFFYQPAILGAIGTVDLFDKRRWTPDPGLTDRMIVLCERAGIGQIRVHQLNEWPNSQTHLCAASGDNLLLTPRMARDLDDRELDFTLAREVASRQWKRRPEHRPTYLLYSLYIGLGGAMLSLMIVASLGLLGWRSGLIMAAFGAGCLLLAIPMESRSKAIFECWCDGKAATLTNDPEAAIRAIEKLNANVAWSKTLTDLRLANLSTMRKVHPDLVRLI